MVRKRRALLVIKDNVEYKSLIETSNEINFLIEGADVDVCSPANQSTEFRDDIRNVLLGLHLNFICWPGGKLFFEKLYMGLRNFLFYLSNFNDSYSCKQKFFIYLGVSDVFVYRANLHKLYIPKFFSKISRFFMRVLGRLITVKNIEVKYDLVIFLRTDSSHNINIFRKLIGINTEVITFVRNVDAITLKGCFSVPSNVTYVSSIRQKGRLKQLHSVEDYGIVRVIEKRSYTFKKIESSKYIITYATSHPKFVPMEPEIVSKIYEKLSSTMFDDFEFHVRLHPSDNAHRYSLPSSVRFFDVNDSYVIYEINGEKMRFFDSKKVTRYHQQLSISNMMIACTSSIFSDALDAGVSKLIYINDPNYFDYPSLYEREHLRDIIESPRVLLCSDINYFSRFVYS